MLRGIWGVFIGGEEDLHCKLEVVWSTAGWPFKWLASQPSRSSPTLGITDLPWHVYETIFENTPNPGQPTKEVWRLTPLWLGWAQALCHIIPSYHILCDYALFWIYWRYAWILVHMMLFVIRCSWNGRSTKLVELVSIKHVSPISWVKCRYVGGKYLHFMTAITTPTHT
jgi:hypothetical protein